VDGQCLDQIDDGAGGTIDFDGGYCIVGGCATNADCSGDGVCSFIQNGEGVCLDGCSVAGDCRPNYTCADVDGNGATECFPL
jgi:hypothetical protein